MPEIQLSTEMKFAAAAALLFVAYVLPLLKPSSFGSLLSRFKSKTSPDTAPDARIDEAVRILLEDSRKRHCRKSVEALNLWVQTRNLASIDVPVVVTPEPTPIQPPVAV